MRKDDLFSLVLHSYVYSHFCPENSRGFFVCFLIEFTSKFSATSGADVRLTAVLSSQRSSQLKPCFLLLSFWHVVLLWPL